MLEHSSEKSAFIDDITYSIGDLISLTELVIQEAKKDAAFYKMLSEHLRIPFDKELINNIMLNKAKLSLNMQEKYYSMTGTVLNLNDTAINKDICIKTAFKTKMFDELEQIDFLRKVRKAFSLPSVKEALFEAITDCQIHSQWLFYLYGKYSA